MNTASRFTEAHSAFIFLLNHSLFYLNKAYCDFGFVLFNRAALSWNISIKLQEVHPSFILTLSLSRLITSQMKSVVIMISWEHHTHTHTHTHPVSDPCRTASWTSDDNNDLWPLRWPLPSSSAAVCLMPGLQL